MVSGGDKGRGRRQFIGRHLMLKGEYADKLLSGEKKTTIRLGIVRPKYEEVIVHGHGRPLAKVRIKSVTVKKAGELTDEDARRDGFRSREELLEALRRVYGDFTPDTPVTIMELEVVQRLDELDTEDPYMGLEPADIARLALRYLRGELGEEEVRVLEDLTRTNSIRETAIRLYGGIHRRYRVRRALRRALRMLLERRLIGAPGRLKDRRPWSRQGGGRGR